MFNVLRCDFVFLASFASMYMFILCFDTGCFGFLLWVLQPSVVGDPLLSSGFFFMNYSFKPGKMGVISYASSRYTITISSTVFYLEIIQFLIVENEIFKPSHV